MRHCFPWPHITGGRSHNFASKECVNVAQVNGHIRTRREKQPIILSCRHSGSGVCPHSLNTINRTYVDSIAAQAFQQSLLKDSGGIWLTCDGSGCVKCAAVRLHAQKKPKFSWTLLISLPSICNKVSQSAFHKQACARQRRKSVGRWKDRSQNDGSLFDRKWYRE